MKSTGNAHYYSIGRRRRLKKKAEEEVFISIYDNSSNEEDMFESNEEEDELHGFAAPLEYIHQLARYYSMRLKGEFEWECDSQCALNRIGVLLKFQQRRRQPYNADIISNLTHRLGQNRTMNIKRTWVQAHQDEKKLPGEILSDAALRNIKVDSIAKDYLLDPRQPQTSDNAAHVCNVDNWGI